MALCTYDTYSLIDYSLQQAAADTHLGLVEASEIDAILGAQESEDVSLRLMGRSVIGPELTEGVEEPHVCLKPRLRVHAAATSQLQVGKRTLLALDSLSDG